MYSSNDHTFVICAYKESEYLEDCIKSLRYQTIKSNILISTSTPNLYIYRIAEKYKLNVFVNNGRKSVADDWNFAYRQAKTALVTLAHQDVVYEQNYLEQTILYLNKADKPIIGFTDYYEIKNDKIETSNWLLNIKRFMLFPLRLRILQSSISIRRLILSLGCPICCPSVTFVKETIENGVFQYGYKGAVDWQAWEKLSQLKGQFVYCLKPLVHNRIHPESVTSNVLNENIRIKEEFEIFSKFWPANIAKLLARLYSYSGNSNRSVENNGNQ